VGLDSQNIAFILPKLHFVVICGMCMNLPLHRINLEVYELLEEDFST